MEIDIGESRTIAWTPIERNDECKMLGAHVECPYCGEWNVLASFSIRKDGSVELVRCDTCEKMVSFYLIGFTELARERDVRNDMLGDNGELLL